MEYKSFEISGLFCIFNANLRIKSRIGIFDEFSVSGFVVATCRTI